MTDHYLLNLDFPTFNAHNLCASSANCFSENPVLIIILTSFRFLPFYVKLTTFFCPGKNCVSHNHSFTILPSFHFVSFYIKKEQLFALASFHFSHSIKKLNNLFCLLEKFCFLIITSLAFYVENRTTLLFSYKLLKSTFTINYKYIL